MTSQLGGSNSLRGGKKKYGPNTKCGNWVELNKEPGQALPPGFPHAMYKTDAQQQMLEGVLGRSKRFGAGLPPPEDPCIDYGRVMNYDKRQGDSHWASITSSEFTPPGDTSKKGKEFSSSFIMAGGISDPAKLNEYRETWTVETDSVRPVRFRTDAVTSANMGVPAAFRLGETRKLPGKPKAVDRFVAKALQTGKMGVVRLREALRQRVCESSPDALALLHPIDLVEAMKGMAVKLDVADSEKVIDFFAPAGGKAASVPDILGGLHGPASGRQLQAATDIFRVLDGAGTGVLTSEGLKKSLGDVCTGYDHEGQETWRMLLENWPLYRDAGEDNGLTMAGFREFVADVACGVGSDDDLEAMLAPFIP